MIRRNQSGSVYVGQTNQRVQQEAKQQGMSLNSYLIYARCKEKGITIQSSTLRNDVQKALSDANVSLSSFFPEESLEVSKSKVQSGPKIEPPSAMGSSFGSMPSNGMNPSAPSHSPVKQPMQGTSPGMNRSSSGSVSPGSMPKSSSQEQPMTPSSGGMG